MPRPGYAVVADRIRMLLGQRVELGRVGNELPGDRIVRTAGSISPAIAGVTATA